jgi:hypothetical protein
MTINKFAGWGSLPAAAVPPPSLADTLKTAIGGLTKAQEPLADLVEANGPLATLRISVDGLAGQVAGNNVNPAFTTLLDRLGADGPLVAKLNQIAIAVAPPPPVTLPAGAAVDVIYSLIGVRNGVLDRGTPGFDSTNQQLGKAAKTKHAKAVNDWLASIHPSLTKPYQDLFYPLEGQDFATARRQRLQALLIFERRVVAEVTEDGPASPD